MRIKSVRIKNFRSFADETIELDNYACFVGVNGAGKSTVLSALNIFFQEKSNSTDVQKLTVEDFHKKNTACPIEITVVFRDLSPRAREILSDYVRNDEVIVLAVAEYDATPTSGKVKQFGVRMGIAQFAPFFKGVGDKQPAKELQVMYDALRLDHVELPDAKSTDARVKALRDFEAARPQLHEPQRSEDEFYGIGGNAKLRSLVQWVYVPAVKNAAEEQLEGRDTAFGKLLARTVRARLNFKQDVADIEMTARQSISALMGESQVALDDVATSLSKRLSEWCHPDAAVTIAWDTASVTIREPSARAYGAESGFSGDLARFGHGFQRAYLLALLQELIVSDDDMEAPTLILACEEPELYQHPPQARHLSALLMKLSESGSQVVVTTHSPYFVSAESFENVRMVRRQHDDASSVKALSFEKFAESQAEIQMLLPQKTSAVAALLGECLRPQMNELFFARKLILVEGTEDSAHIMAWLVLSEQLDQFRRQGIHIIAVDGKSNLLRPTLIAKGLGIPVFVVFDADGNTEEIYRPLHEKDNAAILRSAGGDGSLAFPATTKWGANYVQWPRDLTSEVEEELLASLGDAALSAIVERARCDCGQARSLNKNSTFIQSKLQRAHAAGGKSASLTRLCEMIVGNNW